MHGVLTIITHIGIWWLPLAILTYCCGRYMGSAGIILSGILMPPLLASIQFIRIYWLLGTSIDSGFIFLAVILIQAIIAIILLLPLGILGTRLRARTLPLKSTTPAPKKDQIPDHDSLY